MTLLRRALPHLILAVALAVALAPQRALAQGSPAEARQHFDAGVRLFQSGSFEQALDEFRTAYGIRPHPSVLVNMANCYMELDRPMEAAAHFERYLRESGDDLASDRRDEIERTLGRARGAISTIEVEGDPGVMVFVDGDSVGQTPLRRPVEVNPGPHIVELRHPSAGIQEERVRLRRGGSTTVQADPSRAVAPPPGTEPLPVGPDMGPGAQTPRGPDLGGPPGEPADEGGGLSVPLPTWIAGGVAVVTLAVGIGFGATAMAQKTEFDSIVADIRSRCPAAGEPECRQLRADGQAVSDSQASNALVADVMFITAAAAVGVGLYFLLTQDDEGDEAVQVGASAMPGGGAAFVGGRF